MNDTAWPGPWLERHDRIDESPIARLTALLDPPAEYRRGDLLPTLAHWLYFLPEDRQSNLGLDGHPQTTALLPAISLPRRMWAGGRITFHAPVELGSTVVRRSRVERVQEKEGRSGRLCFVTLLHEIGDGQHVAISEEQDLVFRAMGSATPVPAATDARAAQASRLLTLDAAAVFRFSALTFNAHRIHYDRAYATGVEGYPDCIVQGPFQAMLLADHVQRTFPGADIAQFSFRGMRPLIVDQPFEINLVRTGSSIDLWTRDADGYACMQAGAVLA